MAAKRRRKRRKPTQTKAQRYQLFGVILLITGLFLSVLSGVNGIVGELFCYSGCILVLIGLTCFQIGFMASRQRDDEAARSPLKNAGWWVLRNVADDYGAGFVVDRLQHRGGQGIGTTGMEIAEDTVRSVGLGPVLDEYESIPRCPTCGEIVYFIEEYYDYYCYECEKYLDWFDE